MSCSLTKVDDLTAQLKSLATISTENLKKLNKKFRMEFNYISNHIERNTLTYGETELLLMFDDIQKLQTTLAKQVLEEIKTRIK